MADLIDHEADSHVLPGLPASLQELHLLADLGVLAGPLTHEFNNFINVVLLQAAILESDATQSGREELARLRQHGKTVAALIQEWHRHRSRQRVELQPVDLNGTIRQVIAARPSGEGARVRLELAEPLPPALATAGDLERLLRFLLSNALAAATVVTVRTSLAGSLLQLRLEDDGPAVPPDRLIHFFDPVALRPGTAPLELAACESIVRRRWQGRIWAENRAEGGLAITVQVQAASFSPLSNGEGGD